MTESARRWMFFAALGAFAAVFVTGVGGLPKSGEYPGPYGDMANRTAVPARHVTDVVTAINFDFRGFDTLGEEFILFTSVMGVALLLRLQKGEQESEEEEEDEEGEAPGTSDAVRDLTLGLIGITVTFGLYIVLHGQLTPGGGFQGGVILATAPLLVYLGGDVHRFFRVAPHQAMEPVESLGAGGYGIIGFIGLIFGAPFLANVLPLGQTGSVLSGGTIPLINLSVGLEVSAGFVLLLMLFLQETMKRRLGRRRKR